MSIMHTVITSMITMVYAKSSVYVTICATSFQRGDRQSDNPS